MTGGWEKFRSKDIIFLNVLIMTLSVAKVDDRWLSMGNWRNYSVRERKLLKRKTVPVALRPPPQFSHGLALDDARASAVRDQLLHHTHSTLKPVLTLPRLRQVPVTVWLNPDAVDTVVCAPDDGWRYHPKHVEQFSDINKLSKIASCWIYIFEYNKRTILSVYNHHIHLLLIG